jgi:RND family efflux transporter MFP subunit
MNKAIRPRTVLLLGAAIVFLMLTACSKEEEIQVSDSARPVKTAVVGGPEAGGERRFPGRVDSASKAELAFRVPGTIRSINVVEGDQVEEGQVLAELDPTDYDIRLRDRQATFDQARNDFKRASELVEDGFISRTDFDNREAAFKSAEAALQAAQQDLQYTKLTAPFGGTVAQRYVERAEEIQAKEPIMAIQDQDQLEIKVDVPESIMARIQRAERDTGRDIPVWATFDAAPNRRIDLRMKEVSTRADAATQTFQVTLLMDPPDGFNVLPGMTASVVADLGKVTKGEERYYLPVSAVTADSGLEAFVWVVDESDMTVSKVPVEVGRMSGWSIEAASGIEPGSRIVTAGVGYLAEGMKVRLMRPREQAQPRPEEAPNPVDPDVEEKVEKAKEEAESRSTPGDLTAPAAES